MWSMWWPLNSQKKTFFCLFSEKRYKMQINWSTKNKNISFLHQFHVSTEYTKIAIMKIKRTLKASVEVEKKLASSSPKKKKCEKRHRIRMKKKLLLFRSEYTRKETLIHIIKARKNIFGHWTNKICTTCLFVYMTMMMWKSCCGIFNKLE